MNIVPGILMGAAGGLAILSVAYPRALLFAVIVVAVLTAYHANGLNRRLDALLELLDDHRKTCQ